VALPCPSLTTASSSIAWLVWTYMHSGCSSFSTLRRQTPVHVYAEICLLLSRPGCAVFSALGWLAAGFTYVLVHWTLLVCMNIHIYIQPEIMLRTAKNLCQGWWGMWCAGLLFLHHC